MTSSEHPSHVSSAAIPPTSERPESTQQPRLLSILSLVGGVIGAVISPAGWGIILPIASIVLGILARRREHSARWLWITGIALGVIGFIVSGFSLFSQYLALMAVVGFSGG
jgi:hypothetical protein